MKNRLLRRKQNILFWIYVILFLSMIKINNLIEEIKEPFLNKFLSLIVIVTFITGFILAIYMAKFGLDVLISEGWFAPYSTKKEEKTKFHCNKCNKDFASEDIQGDVCPFCRE